MKDTYVGYGVPGQTAGIATSKKEIPPKNLVMMTAEPQKEEKTVQRSV